MDETLACRIGETDELAKRIRTAMQTEIDKLGIADVAVSDPKDAAYRLSKDPASGQNSLLGTWNGSDGNKQGELAFHADGTFFAEFDVVRVHPGDGKVFVEAVQAWGKGDRVAAEPRLMEMPD